MWLFSFFSQIVSASGKTTTYNPNKPGAYADEQVLYNHAAIQARAWLPVVRGTSDWVPANHKLLHVACAHMC